MYTWLTTINLSNFTVPIENFVTHLIDPASLTIPNDPVFVSYLKPEQIRLMSASSLQEMLKQLDESHAFIEKDKQDASKISMVVKHTDMDKDYEKELKSILQYLVYRKKSRAEIRMLCNVLNFTAIQVLNAEKNNKPLSMGIIEDAKNLLAKDKAAHLLDQYLDLLHEQLNLLKSATSTPPEFKLLPPYLEELITQQQVELDTHQKKLEDENGNKLKPQEVICPFTRQIIDVDRSLVTQPEASQFMMLIVALAHLAKMKNNDLEEFISLQKGDYVDNCFALLQHYVQNPKQFMFTKEQHELLNQFGMNIVLVLQEWQTQMTEKKKGESFRFFGPALQGDPSSQAPQDLNLLSIF